MSNSQNIDAILEAAINTAKANDHEYILVEHLALALLSSPSIVEILHHTGVAASKVKQGIISYLEQPELKHSPENSGNPPKRAVAIDRVFQRAMTQLLFAGQHTLTEEGLLCSILSEKQSHAYYYLAQAGASRENVTEFLKTHQKGGAGPDSAPEEETMLEQFATNLNIESENGRIDPVIGRKDEVIALTEKLAQKKKPNAILLGHPGVGKTAIIEGVARLIVEGKVPKFLKDKVVYSLDIAAMIAGSKFRGEFEDRLKKTLKEIKALGNAIVFIDEIHTIVGAGATSQNTMDASNILKPMLAKGELLCVGATTYDEFHDTIEKDKALMRRFSTIDVDETSVEDTTLIIQGLAKYYEEFHGLVYTEEAKQACVDLADRYIKGKYFPDKAIDVLDAAGARAKLDELDTVDVDMVIGRVSMLSKIPVNLIDINENTMLQKLRPQLKDIVFGQDSSIDTLVDAVELSKSGLREANKPVGSFLLVGNTGTGKTFVVKSLAKKMGLELVKFDMSEYMEKHSVAKLIGAPPGYVGHGEGTMGSGQLIAAIAKHPACVLLLDEIEKAHPDVFNILLQVMEDGILTGSDGKVVKFNDVIIIMTSNAGAAEAERNTIGFNNNCNESGMADAVKRMFSPEFRNRLDATIEFNKLTDDHMKMIIDSELVELNKALVSKNITVDIAISARNWLAENGYSDALGARPMKRLFEQEIKLKLSKEILYSGVAKTGGTVTVNYINDEIVLVVAAETPVAALEAPQE